jgi:hypothetical protein
MTEDMLSTVPEVRIGALFSWRTVSSDSASGANACRHINATHRASRAHSSFGLFNIGGASSPSEVG